MLIIWISFTININGVVRAAGPSCSAHVYDAWLKVLLGILCQGFFLLFCIAAYCVGLFSQHMLSQNAEFVDHYNTLSFRHAPI